MCLNIIHDLDKWDKRFIEMTKLVATWSSCLRHNVGAIIVKDKRVIATGYNGAPKDIPSCVETGICLRQNSKSGSNLNICKAVHAEQNAIAQACKLGISVNNATLYCTLKPCVTCAKILINCGISRIVYIDDYPDDLADKLLSESSMQIDQYVKENKKCLT